MAYAPGGHKAEVGGAQRSQLPKCEPPVLQWAIFALVLGLQAWQLAAAGFQCLLCLKRTPA